MPSQLVSINGFLLQFCSRLVFENEYDSFDTGPTLARVPWNPRIFQMVCKEHKKLEDGKIPLLGDVKGLN